MDILFKREQSKNAWSGTINFKLHSKVEFNEEEQALITRYDFDQTMLIEAIQPGLLGRAVVVSIFTSLLFYLFYLFNLSSLIGFRLGWLPTLVVSFVSGMVVGYIYYHQKRETIYVKDLIVGRYFKCKSVVALARKEAFLENVCAYLRQVIETAKHWDGVQQSEILPLPPEEAKRLIQQGPML